MMRVASCSLTLANVVAIVAFAFLLHQEGLDCLTSSSLGNRQTNNASIKPYWHRPGCYQVGHTRTISIPGCVKFNLSTNACRGFCMSFSIPAAEDIGPEPVERLEELMGTPNEHKHGMSRLEGVSPANNQQLLMLLNKNNQDLSEQDQQQQQLMDIIIGNKKKKSTLRESMVGVDLSTSSLLGQVQGEQQGNNKELDKLNTFLHLSGQTRSPLAGTVGDASDKRDVISVGQCCNMMETEDVTVNLRCGLNETRRLVFKSAKTCECFFCKHV